MQINRLKIYISYIFCILLLWFFRAYAGAEVYDHENLIFFGLLVLFIFSFTPNNFQKTKVAILVFIGILVDPAFLVLWFDIYSIKEKYYYINFFLSFLDIYTMLLISVVFFDLQKKSKIYALFGLLFLSAAVLMAYWPYFRWT